MVYTRFLPFLLLLLHPLYIQGEENNCGDKTNGLKKGLSVDCNNLTELVNALTKCCPGQEKGNEIAEVKSMVNQLIESVKFQGERIEDQQENIRDLQKSLDMRLRENDLKIEWALTDGTLAPKNTSSIMEKIDEALLLLKRVISKDTLPTTVISYTEASSSAGGRPGSCSDIDGGKASGVYQIYPDQINLVNTRCDNSAGGGWTVIQKRFDGSVDFFRGWEEYTEGFGDPAGEYWLGLRHMHALTKAQPMELYVGLTYFDHRSYYAKYASFSVSSENDKFQLYVGRYSGTAGDGLRRHNGGRFSTKDQNNDSSRSNWGNFAHGAWWYKSNIRSNLNGILSKVYIMNGHPRYMYWYNRHHHWASPKASFMMIRPSNFQL